MIVIGASAGGVSALSTLAAQLPANFPAPVLVVLHIGSYHSVLPQILSARGPLPAAHACHGDRMVGGRIYVAPPDRHLLVGDGGQLHLTRGPKEHYTRPSIDPLFLSAALAYGSRAVGVILTGTMDDGTAGLQAIKACGGTVVVQDPDNAQEPSMPRSALKYVAVDHCGPIDGMAAVLAAMTCRERALALTEQPAHLLHEQALELAWGHAMDHLTAIARPSTFVCPDCSGSLWQLIDTQPVRFRCHTGHAYTLRTLQHALKETADEALWTATRALQEQALLLGAVVAVHQEAGENDQASRVEQARLALMKQTKSLRELIEREPEMF